MLWFGACHGEQSVLVADDNPGLRHTVCELLRSQADFEVCEQAENGKETIEKVQQYGAADYVQRICRWLL